MNENRIVITIDPDGAEYDEQGEDAIVKWLIVLAKRIKRDGLSRVTRVLDVNGNTVGRVE